MPFNFVLVGPNEGKTGVWGGHVFTNGVSQFSGTNPSPVLVRSLQSYGAYHDGSAQHEAAVTSWADISVGKNPEPAPPLLPYPPEDAGQEPTIAPFINEKLIAAIVGVDPLDSSLWTKLDDLPLLSAVENAYGQGGLNRRMVSDAVPGFTRLTALAAKNLASEKAKALSDPEVIAARPTAVRAALSATV